MFEQFNDLPEGVQALIRQVAQLVNDHEREWGPSLYAQSFKFKYYFYPEENDWNGGGYCVELYTSTYRIGTVNGERCFLTGSYDRLPKI